MTLEELIDVIADLPAKSLPCPVLMSVREQGTWTWMTARSVKFDEDRVVIDLEDFA